MTPFLAAACCDMPGMAMSFPPTKAYLWVTGIVCLLVLALGITLGVLIAKKRAAAKGGTSVG